MLPVLLDLKFIKIYTFGVFLLLSFFWGSFMLWKNIRLTSFKEDDIFDSLLISLFGALFFGRLVYVILHFKDFGFDLLKFLLINGYPGISIYGVLFGGFLTFYLISVIKKIGFTNIIALGFGKLGAFFSGVEIGEKTKFVVSIKYTGFDGFRHLTPLYESLLYFLAAFIAYKILFEIRKDRFKHGFSFIFFFWYFGLVNFLFDKIKVDKLYFFGYRFNSTVSLAILLTSSLYFLYYFKDLLLDKLSVCFRFIRTYGQKTYQRIYNRAKKKLGRRKEKNTPAN